jgi:hemolysin-activating ACP:hemolysin acyltransferase
MTSDERLYARDKDLVEVAAHIKALHERIGALEDRWEIYKITAKYKQRAVNEALQKMLPYIHHDQCCHFQWEALQDALHEALK